MTNLESMALGYWSACSILRAPVTTPDKLLAAEVTILTFADPGQQEVPERLRQLADAELGRLHGARDSNVYHFRSIGDIARRLVERNRPASGQDHPGPGDAA